MRTLPPPPPQTFIRNPLFFFSPYTIEFARVDLCDPAWSLNPVLAPMPMPEDDEVDANDENANDGGGGGNDNSSRRRRGLSGDGGRSKGNSDIGGRLVAVAAVNPEAQTAPVASNASFGIGSLFSAHRAPLTSNSAEAVFGTGGDVFSVGEGREGLEQSNANAGRSSTTSRSKSKNSRSVNNKRRFVAAFAASGAMPASAAAELLHPKAEGVLAEAAAEILATPKNKRNAADARGIGAVAGSDGRSGASRRGGQGGLRDGSPIRKVARYGSDDARSGLSSAGVDTGDTVIANADLASSTGSGTSRENIGSQGFNVAVGVPGEQSQALTVSTADVRDSTVDTTVRSAAAVDRGTPLGNGSGLIASSGIAAPSPASPVNLSAATVFSAVGVTTAALPAAATPTATYSGADNCIFPGAAASTPAPPPAAELPAVRADRGGRVHNSHHDNAHQSLVSSGATDLVAANKDVRESGGRKGGGGNGGIAIGEDSGYVGRGDSGVEGRRPRPAGKALTKEMFGSPAQCGGVANTRYENKEYDRLLAVSPRETSGKLFRDCLHIRQYP